MGVPTFFLSIVKNKHYKNVHSGVKKGEEKCDYFFMDYNGIVYSAYERIKHTFEGQNLSKERVEELIIEEVVRYTKYIVTEVIKPQVLTYIAMDGPAPRAKMVQQRSRRYKAIKDKEYVKEMKEKYQMDRDQVEWDRSANISPGTEFMEKLSQKLLETMKKKEFSKHCPTMQVILNNSNVPGEGEHKFLGIIRDMRKIKSKENAPVYIYGKDADLIVLAVITHKRNLHIMREVASESDTSLRKQYQDFEFLSLHIDSLRSGFKHQLTRTFKNKDYDETRILNDYIFLTFLVGNDFVSSMPFLKIRKGGLETLIAIYHEIREEQDDYLVNYHHDHNTDARINPLFLKALYRQISVKEDQFMKEQQREFDKYFSGYRDTMSLESEVGKSPYQLSIDRYLYERICSPVHPLFQVYQEEFREFDYNQEPEFWKKDYYVHYLNVDPTDVEDYNNMVDNLCKNYLESLVFTLKYYHIGCPSWKWHYSYRVAPLPSDVYQHLMNDKTNIETVHFEMGNPYTPFEQLMLIYPPQMDFLVPEPLRPIMINDKYGCLQFYPTDFRLDATVGIKTTYCEAILPEIDEEILMEKVKKAEENLTENEKKRNEIRDRAIIVK